MSDVDSIFSELPAPVAAEALAILDKYLGTTTQRDAQAIGVTGHWLTVYALGVLRSCERRCSALADDLQRSPAERSDARELWFFLGPVRERVAAEKDQQLAMARQAIEGLQAP